MAIAENSLRAEAAQHQTTDGATAVKADISGEIRYPPGIKLFGEEKQKRDREIAEEVARYIDPSTGRLRAADAQQIYHEIGRRYGLSASGVIQRTPADLKPTNAETLEFARSQKGKHPPGERPVRARRRRAQRDDSLTQGGRRRRRDASVAQRVREAAEEFLDPATGRIPAARATEVYHLLSDRFERTPGTISNYLKGLTPTASECATLRWDRHRERQGAGSRTSAHDDYTSHPAALFPAQRPAPVPRRRKGDDPLTMKERVKSMMGPDGRLIDYDESYQAQRLGETIETKLDEATEEFLRSFRVQQAAEFIDALRDCGRSMNSYVLHTQRYLQEFQQSLQAAGSRIVEVAGITIQDLKQRHSREIQDLKEYVEALEEDNERLTAQLNRVRAILGATAEAGVVSERAGAGARAGSLPRAASGRSGTLDN
jgi:hypothetical protein